MHWAEDALLDFLEFLALHVTHVPLMVVATSRPELFERHPSFAAAARVNRVSLEALSRDETEQLIGSVLEELTADLRTSIAEQAQGNPFYAEESARLVRDRALDKGHVEEEAGTSLLAGSVQAIIAARLDGLAAEQKSVLGDAAVAGDVFWDGLLATMGGRSAHDVTSALDDLAAKQLVYRVRTSSMADEREYAFCHALAREVAYGQLPRLARAKKHAAVAAWTEEKAGDAADDLAEVRSHHYLTALELSQAAGDAVLAETLLGPALDLAALAGERALRLDVVAAKRYFERGLAAAGTLDAARGRLLRGLAETAHQSGDAERARELFQEAAEACRNAGDVAGEAHAKAWLAMMLDVLCQPGGDEPLAEAVAMINTVEPSRLTLEVLDAEMWMKWTRDERSQGIPEVVESLAALAERLGEPPPFTSLCCSCLARLEMDDLAGYEAFADLLSTAMALGLSRDSAVIMANRATVMDSVEGPARASAVSLENADFAAKHGLEGLALSSRGMRVETLWLSGEWQAALDLLDAVSPLLEAAGDVWDLAQSKVHCALLLVAQGRSADAHALLDWVSTKAADTPISWVVTLVMAVEATLHFSAGEFADAQELLRDWAARPFWKTDAALTVFALTAARMALDLDDLDLARRIAESRAGVLPLQQHAVQSMWALIDETGDEHEAAAAGFADAAARWHDFGVPYEEAQALLGQGRCLVVLGRAPEAAAPLAAAREIFARLGARPALEQTDEWLARTDPA